MWLTSAFTWILIDTTAGVLVLLIGGFLIYRVTKFGTRLLGNSGSVDAARRV